MVGGGLEDAWRLRDGLGGEGWELWGGLSESGARGGWPAPLGGPLFQGPAGFYTNSVAKRSTRSLPKSDVPESDREGFGRTSDSPKSRDSNFDLNPWGKSNS